MNEGGNLIVEDRGTSGGWGGNSWIRDEESEVST